MAEIEITYRGIKVPDKIREEFETLGNETLQAFKAGVDSTLNAQAEEPTSGYEYYAEPYPEVGDRYIFRFKPGQNLVERFYEAQASDGWEPRSNRAVAEIRARYTPISYHELPAEAR